MNEFFRKKVYHKVRVYALGVSWLSLTAGHVNKRHSIQQEMQALSYVGELRYFKLDKGITVYYSYCNQIGGGVQGNELIWLVSKKRK